MFPIFKALLLAAFGATLAPSVLADFASCQTGWEWANNTRNQNPCEIAGRLEAACQGFSVYFLGPISSGTNYVTPQVNASANICQCNTVMYSLYMACTACQNVSIQTWEFWSQNCAPVYVTQYPNPISIDTAVPRWAYLDVTANSNRSFSAVLAKAAGDSPESVHPTPSVASIPTSTPSSASSSTVSSDSSLSSDPVSPTKSSNSGSSGTPGPSGTSPSSGESSSTSSINSQSNPKSSTVGAIVGGVVGGLLSLGIICGLIARYLTHRPRNSELSEGNQHSRGPVSFIAPVPMKFYDPSDPSTFPPESVTSPHSPSTTRTTELLTARSATGHYTGAPEL